MFTARYGLGPYITQISFVLKGLNQNMVDDILYFSIKNLKASRKTLSLTVREERRPRVFEIRLPRKITFK